MAIEDLLRDADPVDLPQWVFDGQGNILGFEKPGGGMYPLITTKIHFVSGAPAGALGNDGDTAIDKVAKFIYGPKESGAWPAGVSFGTGGAAAVTSVNGGTGDVTLNAADVGADPAGTGAAQAASAVTAHEGLANPHPIYMTQAESDARYALLGAAGDVTGWVNALQNGIVGDGSDESTAIQTFIDANKGKTLVFPAGKEYYFAGVTLNGATYNSTKLYFFGEHKLKQRPTSGTNTFGGAYVGLLFKDVDGCELVYRGNGNRNMQPAEEHVYNVGLAAATNFKVPFFAVREVRGDGLYISQSSWTAETAQTIGVSIGHFDAYNSADDGRNALSIIAGENIAIGTFRSYQVGGVINGARMPGGLDIEPNQTYQICRNITVGACSIVAAGTGCLSLSGKGGSTSPAIQNVTINNFSVIQTIAPNIVDSDGNTTQTGSNGVQFIDCKDVVMKGSIRYLNAYGDALRVQDCKNVHVEVSVEHVRTAARIGQDGTSATGPVDSYFHITGTDISRWGYDIQMATNTTFAGSFSGPALGAASMYDTRAPIHFNPSLTIVDCTFKVDCEGHADWSRSIRLDTGGTPTITNCSVRDCRFHGSAWAGVLQRVGDVAIPRFNVEGVTNMTAMPSGGSWSAGTFVRNDAPVVDTAATPDRLLVGWHRLTTGSANVANTDWALCYCDVA